MRSPTLQLCTELPDYPGVAGTAFWVEIHGLRLLLTAKHCIQDAHPSATTTGFFVPSDFGHPESIHAPDGHISLIDVAWPRPMDTSDSDQYDIAISWHESCPFSSKIVPLRLNRIAKSSHFAPGVIFAIAGYPRTEGLLKLDYDNASIQSPRFSTLGTYKCAMTGVQSVHTLELDSTIVSGSSGRPEGLSGSPVFRLNINPRKERVDAAPLLGC